MEEITWLDVIKIMIPVLTVVIAGGFALFNLRHSIKLQARNKWKEDFRNYVSEYLKAFLKMAHNAHEWTNKNKIGAGEHSLIEYHQKAVDISLEMTGRANLIKLMMEEQEKNSEELFLLFRENQKHINGIIEGVNKKTDYGRHIDELFTLTKKIYNTR